MTHFIGLMSGTSMDAIDAVLVEFAPTAKLVAHHSHPIPDGLRNRLTALIGTTQFDIREYGSLDVAIGRLFGEAALALLKSAEIGQQQVAAIGSHGQTIFHSPEGDTPFTLQIGDPNSIAQMTGITTVADFRRRDMAAGGQGAPLVPAFHQALFRSNKHNRVILNIGGIANVTLLPRDEARAVTGFDTGPGNCLLDEWIQHQGKARYDHDGKWAASGQIDEHLLERLLSDHYFAAPPPKSSGREYFNLAWQGLDGYGAAAEDLQATFAELTVESIARAIEQHAPSYDQLFVCGGGAHNRYLVQRLTNRLSSLEVDTTAALGIDPDWVEAIAFAWLAKQTLAGEPGNLPAVTGAKQPVILGAIYPA